MRYVLMGSLFASLAAGPAAASSDVPVHPALTDRFYVGVGVFFPTTNTQAQLRSNATGIAATVDFEESLDMERSKAAPGVIGRWRFGERWRVDAEYFQLNRSAERTIDREIVWGDQTFPVNARVSSEFDFYDLRLSVGYSFFKRTDKELGVGLGLHMASYEVSLSSINFGSDSEDVLAPLPVLSIYSQFALTERWALATRLDRFSLNYDRYSGSLTNLALDLLYQPFRHVGFGLGYRALAIRMEATGDRATLHMRQAFQGPILYTNVSF